MVKLLGREADIHMRPVPSSKCLELHIRALMLN
jgi:hypothetical protein